MAPWVLDGGRVVLRPTGDSDFDFLRRFFDDPLVYATWGGAPLSDEEIRVKYLGGRRPTVECFIVEIADQPGGLVQYAEEDGGGSMDMTLLPEHRGQGIGTSVVHAVAAFVREELGWRRLTVDPDVSNDRGVNFWTKAGFVPTGIVTDDGREPYWLMEWPAQP